MRRQGSDGRRLMGSGNEWGSARLLLVAAALALGCGATHSFPGGSGGSMTDGGAPSEPGKPCDQEGARQCSGDIPQLCSKGHWVSEATCPDACTGAGVCVCATDSRRCEGDTPQACVDGAWMSDAPCSGSASSCTGAGVCAAFRLLDTGVVSLTPPGAAAAGPQLTAHTLSSVPRLCSAKYCISGEIR
jgi:hypothetical protein